MKNSKGGGVNIEPGSVFEVVYPFVRCEVEILNDDRPITITSWKPGAYSRHIYPDDCELFADSVGKMVLTVIDTHKPGKFPTRVFFTRTWVDPEGKRFGKKCLRITTMEAFKRRASGYMHEYMLDALSGATEKADDKA